MPPRYAYWTILIGDEPTAFRAGAQEDLLPTLKRLQARNPSARMMWFQNGKLWPSRIDAQEAMRARGEMGRRGDDRQAGSGFRERERKPFRERSDRGERPAWKPKTSTYAKAPTSARASVGKPADRQDFKTQDPGPRTSASAKLDWKPKGEFIPAPKRADRADWKSKPSRSEKPEWKPKGSFDRKPEWNSRTSRPQKPSRPQGSKASRPDWKSKPSRPEKPEWKPKGSFDRHRPEWKPRSQDSGPKTQDPRPKTPEKRKWIPKEEYKKSMGIEARKDKNWRPGGDHKDPRQKYKDAKKAKWTRFKQTIRARSGGKGKKSS